MKISHWAICFFPQRLLILATAVAMVLQTAIVVAQDGSVGDSFERLRVDGNLKGHRTEVREMLRRGIPSGQEALFDDYFRNYELAEWTDPANYPSVVKRRQALGRRLTGADDLAAHDRLNTLLLKTLPDMATKNYHPVVRYNAMLLLGELNERPVEFGGTSQPLSLALPILLKMWLDDNQPDVVRIAALLGIDRHAQLGMTDPQVKQGVSQAMLDLATTVEVPGRSSDAHDWLRVRAMEILATLGEAGKEGAVAQAMADVLSEPDASLDVRAAAAETLGHLTYKPPGVVDPGEISRRLAKLAHDACMDQITQCQEDPEQTLNPRILIDQLMAVRAGLTGQRDPHKTSSGGMVVAAAKAEDKTRIDGIKKAIDRWLKKLDNPDLRVKVDPEEDQKKNTRDREPGGFGDFGGAFGGMGADLQIDSVKVASDEVIEYLLGELKDFEKYFKS